MAVDWQYKTLHQLLSHGFPTPFYILTLLFFSGSLVLFAFFLSFRRLDLNIGWAFIFVTIFYMLLIHNV